MLRNWLLVLAIALVPSSITMGVFVWVGGNFESRMKKDVQILTTQLKEAGMASGQIQALDDALTRIQSSISFLALMIVWILWIGLLPVYILSLESWRAGRANTRKPSEQPSY